jgi:hypothetical protein
MVWAGSLVAHVRAYRSRRVAADDPQDAFWTRAVQAPRLPELMGCVCRNGFEHHGAMTGASCAMAVTEGPGNYVCLDVVHDG